MFIFFLYTAAFLGALALTKIIRKYAQITALLDIPNDRSSHVTPTPRGGGLAFVLVFLVMDVVLGQYGLTSLPVLWATFISGSFVAALGFLDDRYHLSAGIRLGGHLFAAALALYILAPLTPISSGNWLMAPGLLLNLMMLLYLVWLLNLFNFMDGIDGLAASETAFVCISAALIFLFFGHSSLSILPLALAAAVGGFLYWNFPPARIFMGDVGSGFLGLLVGLLSMQANIAGTQFWWSWLILLGVFIVDATVTLIRRGLQRERIWQAHCSHAYQHAAKYYGSHRPVTLRVLLINLFWLFPWALIAASTKLSGLTCLTISYLPLILLAFYFQAGCAVNYQNASIGREQINSEKLKKQLI